MRVWRRPRPRAPVRQRTRGPQSWCDASLPLWPDPRPRKTGPAVHYVIARQADCDGAAPATRVSGGRVGARRGPGTAAAARGERPCRPRRSRPRRPRLRLRLRLRPEPPRVSRRPPVAGPAGGRVPRPTDPPPPGCLEPVRPHGEAATGARGRVSGPAHHPHRTPADGGSPIGPPQGGGFPPMRLRHLAEHAGKRGAGVGSAIDLTEEEQGSWRTSPQHCWTS